jgi:hypothetical protein
LFSGDGFSIECGGKALELRAEFWKHIEHHERLYNNNNNNSMLEKMHKK